MQEAYFELNGKYAAIIPSKDGGFEVIKSQGISIAEFMRDGTIISKEKFEREYKKKVD